MPSALAQPELGFNGSPSTSSVSSNMCVPSGTTATPSQAASVIDATVSAAGTSPPTDEERQKTISLVSNKGVPLSTLEAEQEAAPPWGFHLPISGTRDHREVFALARTGDWIRRWIFTPNSLDELNVPANAIEHSSTQTTTVFRPQVSTRRAGDEVRLSSHWLLTPYATFNGYTIGVVFMECLYMNLDDMCVDGAPSGKFAMNEETGELLATSYKENGSLIVGWVKCFSSCERIREVIEFEKPVLGSYPRSIVKRNSFYERRNCRICGVLKRDNTLPTPCTAVPRIRTTQPKTFKNFGIKGFRGSYFGTCEKTLFDPSNNTPWKRTTGAVFIDLRHSIPSVQEKMKLQLRRGLMSFGTAPRLSSALFCNSDQFKYLMEAGDENDPSKLLGKQRRKRRRNNSKMTNGFDPTMYALGMTNMKNGIVKRSKGGANAAAATTLRKRNRDESNRDSVRYHRIQRNRESARRANERRKQQNLKIKNELEHLKKIVIPHLKSKMELLGDEREELRRKLDGKSVFNDVDLLSFDADSFLAPSDVTYDDDLGDFSVSPPL